MFTYIIREHLLAMPGDDCNNLSSGQRTQARLLFGSTLGALASSLFGFFLTREWAVLSQRQHVNHFVAKGSVRPTYQSGIFRYGLWSYDASHFPVAVEDRSWSPVHPRPDSQKRKKHRVCKGVYPSFLSSRPSNLSLTKRGELRPRAPEAGERCFYLEIDPSRELGS